MTQILCFVFTPQDTLKRRMVQLKARIEETTSAVEEERSKNVNLLHLVFPPDIAQQLWKGESPQTHRQTHTDHADTQRDKHTHTHTHTQATLTHTILRCNCRPLKTAEYMKNRLRIKLRGMSGVFFGSEI